MKQFSCLIKGGPLVAEAAVKARGLDYAKTIDGPYYDTTFVRVWATEQTFATLVEWLSETPPFTPGGGYPVGTLLHFTAVPALPRGEADAKPTT